ncbi:hypothetical protein NFI96_007718 [Prochilodus magdalenae]|nr:hypothetical protein NFI96_007718 [Prochilodus magdalenae]
MVLDGALRAAWLCVLALGFFPFAPCKARIYTNHWAVRITGGAELAERIADRYGYRNLGQIGDLKDYYHFFHSRTIKRSTLSSRGTHSFISMEPKVEWIEQQIVKRRVKRDYKPSYTCAFLSSPAQTDYIYFNDAKWSNMWYIHRNDNINSCQSDMNIVGAWKRGYTGKDVVVTILDDGIERNHPDLIQNYDSQASYDVNGNDLDPMPRYDVSNENKMAQMLILPVLISLFWSCAVWGVRMLDGDVTDMVEAKSLSLNPQHIDIYSASWGPDDDGKTVDGPASLARQAFENGIRLGRKGRGSIYVWASGNGGRSRDHCSCDGYTNSIYTISISSTAESGHKPWYLEECSSTLTTTYSSGENYDRKIITTDLRQRCTDSHTGTSASAPMAAGIIALALEANPVGASLIVPDCTKVSHLYGFGLMDAEAMVKEAERWKTVPPQHICVENADKQIKLFDHSMEGFKNWEFMTTHCWGEKAAGDWILEIYDTPSQLRNQKTPGKLKEWSLVLYGTSVHPYSFRSEKPRSMVEAQVDEEYSEEYVGPCDPECSDNGCEGPGPHQCINCLHYFLKFKNNTRMCVPECPSGFYRDDKRRCKKCSPLCESCVGSRSDQCTSCRPGLYLREGANMCVYACPEGSYLELGTGMEACTKCAAGYYLEEWRCVTSCNAGYYMAEHTENGEVQKSCRKCDHTCYACTGPGERNCSTCVNGYNLENGVCVVSTICKDGQYVTENGDCKSCDNSCYKCTGPKKDDCLSCMFTRVIDDGSCVGKCSSGKFKMEGQCHRCHHTCHECSDEGPDKCTSCNKDRFEVERYLFDHECRLSCPEGHFHSSEYTCEPCPPNCSVCSSSSHCLHCAASYYSKDGTCVKLDCVPGKVADGDADDCIPCEEGCQKCLSGNPKHCLSCWKDYYQLGSSCQRICPEKTFGDNTTMMCMHCDDHCDNCDESQCYLCEKEYYLSGSMCVDKCMEGFYGDSKNECEPCHPDCRSCGGPFYNDCDSCEDGMKLVEGKCIDISRAVTCAPSHFLNSMFLVAEKQICVSSCPAGTYGNGTSGHCEDCLPGCILCQEAHNCQKCRADEVQLYLQNGLCVVECQRGYPSGGECVSCAEGCASCDESAEHCLSCDKDHLFYKHTCVTHCPENYYVKDEECDSCPHRCTQCERSGTCSECAQYYFLHDGKCLDDCPKGYFRNVQEKKCESCHDSCTDCIGPDADDCTSCWNPLAVHYNGECLSSCPSNTYRDKTECRDHMCVAMCPDGYYSDNDKRECVKCYVTCATCHGYHSTNCLTCKADHFRLGNSCVEKCPPSFYSNTVNGTCEACDLSCAECSGNSNSHCTGCRDGYFLLEQKGICLHVCPSGYFPNTLEQSCQRCHPSCKTCKSSGMLQCTSCYEGFRSLGGICSSLCLSGQYTMPTNPENCVPCHPSCSECKGPGPYNCTGCFAAERLTDDGRCLSCCGEYKHKDSSPMPWECCRCHDAPFLDWCILGTNYNFHSREQVPAGKPGLVAIITIILLLALGVVVLLSMQWRPKLPAFPSNKSKGYTKVDKQPSFTTATLRDSIQAEYCDRNGDEEEEDEDNEDEIVYMGQDGVVYKKFKYGLLDQEEDDLEMEYDDSIYT